MKMRPLRTLTLTVLPVTGGGSCSISGAAAPGLPLPPGALGVTVPGGAGAASSQRTSMSRRSPGCRESTRELDADAVVGRGGVDRVGEPVGAEVVEDGLEVTLLVRAPGRDLLQAVHEPGRLLAAADEARRRSGDRAVAGVVAADVEVRERTGPQRGRRRRDVLDPVADVHLRDVVRVGDGLGDLQVRADPVDARQRLGRALVGERRGREVRAAGHALEAGLERVVAPALLDLQPRVARVLVRVVEQPGGEPVLADLDPHRSRRPSHSAVCRRSAHPRMRVSSRQRRPQGRL